MEQYLQVGVISSTHGIRGEVKVFPTTDDVKRFKRCKKLMLDTREGWRELEVEGVKFFKQFAILKLQGIDSINEAEAYKGQGLFVTRENAVELKQDEYFIADLIGLCVQDEQGVQTGILRDVMETGANDVYVIEMTDGRELLLPAIRECVLEVNIREQYIRVHIMEGLLD